MRFKKGVPTKECSDEKWAGFCRWMKLNGLKRGKLTLAEFKGESVSFSTSKVNVKKRNGKRLNGYEGH
jgi:hypothetical protein